MNLKSQCGWNYFLEKWNSSPFSKFLTIKVCDEQTLPPCYHFLPLRSFIWIISISSNYLNDTNCDFYSPWNIIFMFDQDSSKTLYYENQSVCSITWLCASKSCKSLFNKPWAYWVVDRVFWKARSNRCSKLKK